MSHIKRGIDRLAITHQPKTPPMKTSDDIPAGPFSEHELREQWNCQAGKYRQWDSLESCEQLAWAQARAIVADRAALAKAEPAPPAEVPPSGYAYRYPDGIRFNSGGQVNACRPIEAMPYWFSPPVPAPPAELLQQRHPAPAPPAEGGAIGPEWQPCVKLPITVHVREQRPGEIHVSTREGITPIRPDDLIMRGVQGEEYPIGRELFNRTYRLGVAAPQPPAEGEVAELVEWLKRIAEELDYHHDGINPYKRVCRAAELLQQREVDIQSLEQELETERLRLAVCGVIAMSDTPESAARNRACHPEYWSASADDITRQIDELMRLRAQQTPVPVSEGLPVPEALRYEFSVYDADYVEQAGGSAPTYAQALSEGQRYLAEYQQDGPHTLELRRVEVLNLDALPLPAEEGEP